MDADEKEICEFLSTSPGQFVALREIARKAGGKWRYREDANWASAVLIRLVERGAVEADSSGHFRLVPVKEKTAKTKWISPQMQAILKKSGQKFDAGK